PYGHGPDPLPVEGVLRRRAGADASGDQRALRPRAARAGLSCAVPQHLRRDGSGPPPRESVRQSIAHAGSRGAGHGPVGRGRPRHPACRLRRLSMPERVVLCVGTKKGLFVAQAAKPRKRFDLRGPFGPGVAVYSTLIDARGTPRIYASSCNAFFGMKVLRSTDLGKSFKETKSAPAFPKDDGRALANIWSLEPGTRKKDIWC